MLPLTTWFDGMFMLLIAAVAGAIGGFAYEMMLKPEHEGYIRIPHHLQAEHIWDAGFLASLLLGAIAGAAITLIALPVNTISNTLADGTTQSLQQVECWRLVILALIAGTAGPSTIRAAQNTINARQAVVVAQEETQKAEEAKNEAQQGEHKAKEQAEQVAAASVSAIADTKDALNRQIDAKKSDLLRLVATAQSQLPAGFIAEIETRVNNGPMDADAVKRWLSQLASQDSVKTGYGMNNAKVTSVAEVDAVLEGFRRDAVAKLDRTQQQIIEALARNE